MISPLNALMGDQIDKLKTDMGVKAVVLRHDDHDQEMKGVYKILHFVIFVYIKYIICIDPLPFCVFWQANLYEAPNRAYGDMY